MSKIEYFCSMTLAQLSYIVAVDNYRHFGIAAENCFVTQPTLSIQIQKLEEELGVIIFNRSLQPVEPTEIGEKIIRQARTILHESERLQTIIESETGEFGGTFRLGVIPTAAPYLIPLFLRSFTEKYPKIELIIHEITTPEIIRLINKDALDAGILALPISDSGIINIPLYYEPFIAYLPKGHSLSSKKELLESDIPVKELLLLNEGHCLRGQILKLCNASERDWNNENGRILFESGNLDTLIRLVQQDFGLTLLPFLTVFNSKLDNINAVTKKFKDPQPRREMGIIHSKSYLKKHLIDALIKEIKSCLPQELKNYNKENVIY